MSIYQAYHIVSCQHVFYLWSQTSYCLSVKYKRTSQILSHRFCFFLIISMFPFLLLFWLLAFILSQQVQMFEHHVHIYQHPKVNYLHHCHDTDSDILTGPSGFLLKDKQTCWGLRQLLGPEGWTDSCLLHVIPSCS